MARSQSSEVNIIFGKYILGNILQNIAKQVTN